MFTRSGGSLQLTRKGERLLSYAEQFEHLAELVQKEVIDPEDFVETLKTDIFQDQVYVFTPGGDVIDLRVEIARVRS